MQKRSIGIRPNFNIQTSDIISSNYYPVNSAIAIRKEDSDLQFTVMNDRSQGGSVLVPGRIELM